MGNYDGRLMFGIFIRLVRLKKMSGVLRLIGGGESVAGGMPKDHA